MLSANGTQVPGWALMAAPNGEEYPGGDMKGPEGLPNPSVALGASGDEMSACRIAGGGGAPHEEHPQPPNCNGGAGEGRGGTDHGAGGGMIDCGGGALHGSWPVIVHGSSLLG